MTSNLYDELGVDKTATKEEIRKAYRQKAAKLHPDVNKEEGSVEKFKRVCEAYAILYDDTSRYKYDKTGEEEKPADRKPVNIEERVKAYLYQIVYNIVDKLGSNLNNNNLQVIINETANRIKEEINTNIKSNKSLLKAAKEKQHAILIKQNNIIKESLLNTILEAKIKAIETQEILPLRESRRELLTEKKIINKVLQKIKTDCIDKTIIVRKVDPMEQWDRFMNDNEVFI